MRIGEILYFSPSFRFDQVSWDDKEELINAFRDRVEGFYLNPAKMLNENGYAFAAGIVCITTIDFLAKISMNGDTKKRIKKWVVENIQGFDESLAARFYDDFRNGLVHEGRIKRCGQFSYDFDKVVHQEDGIMIINPIYLLKEIDNFFDKFIKEIKSKELAFQIFKCTLMKDFQDDIKCTQM